MNTWYALLAAYLAVGFAKWVLDMSRVCFLHALVIHIDACRARTDGRPCQNPLALLWVLVCGITVQTLIAWPEILMSQGLLAFLQPISKQKAAAIFCTAAEVDVYHEENRP